MLLPVPLATSPDARLEAALFRALALIPGKVASIEPVGADRPDAETWLLTTPRSCVVPTQRLNGHTGLRLQVRLGMQAGLRLCPRELSEGQRVATFGRRPTRYRGRGHMRRVEFWAEPAL
jgi:hypothetical protein